MDMTMSSATPNRVEVVTSVQRRRRWTPEQKLEIVKQTNEPGSSVSMVARQFGITAAQLFQWRKAYLQGSLMAVGANETVVPASELQEAMRRIKQLEGALGRKTLENEILKGAGQLVYLPPQLFREKRSANQNCQCTELQGHLQ